MQPGHIEPRDPGLPGTLVLDRDLRPVSWTTAARAWIDALPSAQLFASWGMLPSVVYPTAVLARSAEADNAARALVQATDGRWVAIEAAALEGERDGEVAVSLRSATPSETFDLLCRVYALSQREREVVSLLVGGLDTRAIAARLFISAHTVHGPSEVGVRENGHPQPPRIARSARSLRLTRGQRSQVCGIGHRPARWSNVTGKEGR